MVFLTYLLRNHEPSLAIGKKVDELSDGPCLHEYFIIVVDLQNLIQVLLYLLLEGGILADCLPINGLAVLSQIPFYIGEVVLVYTQFEDFVEYDSVEVSNLGMVKNSFVVSLV